jgi:hypothetical protein
LLVDVWCEEVRVTATAQLSQTSSMPASPTTSGTLSNTQSPNGTSATQSGTVLPAPAVVTGNGSSADVAAASAAGEGGAGSPPADAGQPWIVNLTPPR